MEIFSPVPGETSNTANIADKVSADIFGIFGGSRRPHEDLNFPWVIKEHRNVGDQMLALESLVLKYEGQQRGSKSAGETLDRLLVEFHEGVK